MREDFFGKEDIVLLAQLLHTMKEVVEAMESAAKEGDYEKLNFAKRELLDLQRRIAQLL